MVLSNTGRRNDLLKFDVVDLHRVQALCASKVDLVVKGPLFPTFAMISGISMWTRVMKLKFCTDAQAPGLTLSVGSDNADTLARTTDKLRKASSELLCSVRVECR